MESSSLELPAQLTEVIERSLTCEYASVTSAGTPITVPITPYLGNGTIDVSTGLAYPAKAERARRNPKVALLFADPIGAGRGDLPVVLVQGHAAVHDADLQGNTDRYARVAMAKLPDATKGQPKFLLKRMRFYYARIWIEIVPQRILWWTSRELASAPQTWQAEPGRALPASDAAPSGRQPAAWLSPPSDWRGIAGRALRELPLADLTFVDAAGYPVCVPVSAGELAGEHVPLTVGSGAPPCTDRPCVPDRAWSRRALHHAGEPHADRDACGRRERTVSASRAGAGRLEPDRQPRADRDRVFA